jgi:hypothetical protein
VETDAHPGQDPRAAWGRGWAHWALRRWETFPADLRPRPLVLTGPLTRFERGFRSGAAKHAFLHGDIEAAVPLPDGLLEMLRSGEAGRNALPGKLARPGPLLITRASQGRAEFGTDRGRRELPAWQLGGPEVDGTFWVLDPAVASRRWEPPEPAPPKPFGGLPHRVASTEIEDDDLTLHFTFTGSPPSLTEYPAAEAVETDQAIVILPVERDVGPPGFRAAPGCFRTVTARLGRPLGGRVLVDLDASPVAVVTRNPA